MGNTVNAILDFFGSQVYPCFIAYVDSKLPDKEPQLIPIWFSPSPRPMKS